MRESLVDGARSEQVVVEEVEREGHSLEHRVQRDATIARVARLGVLPGAGLLVHGRAHDRVTDEALAEVQLRALEDDRTVVGEAVVLHPVRRCHHQAAAVGGDEVATLPRLVPDRAEVELAGRHDHLLHPSVDLVAVDVEVADRESGAQPLVVAESLDQLTWVQQAHVLQRFDVTRDLAGGERPELHGRLCHIGDVERLTRGRDVAIDVGGLAVFLVRVHHERLDGGRIDDTPEEGHHGPQRRRHHRQPPRIGLQCRQEQRRDEEGDQRQQHDGWQLGVHDGIGGALHEAAPLGGELVAGDPVVAGLHDRKERQEHSDVGLGRASDLRLGRLEHHTAVQHVREQHEQRDEDERGEEPVEGEGHERQPEHVEADVVAELLVGDPERLAVAEQGPRRPLTGGRQREQQSEEDGDGDAHQAQSATEQVVEPLHHRVHVRRERERGEPVGDHEVEDSDGDEGATEHREQRDLADQHTPEHVATADARVPQVVDVEAGQEPGGQQQGDEDRCDDDQGDASAIAQSRRTVAGREIRRCPHVAGGYRSPMISKSRVDVPPALPAVATTAGVTTIGPKAETRTGPSAERRDGRSGRRGVDREVRSAAGSICRINPSDQSAGAIMHRQPLCAGAQR